MADYRNRFRAKMKRLGYSEILVGPLGVIKPFEKKKRQRFYGAVYTRSENGRDDATYVAFRREKDLWRGYEKTRSEAIQKGVAGWALNVDTLSQVARDYGVKAICVFNYESGEMYRSTVERFLDNDYAPQKDYSARGGARQRYMPTYKFDHSYVTSFAGK